jgi:hypothetical protein
MPKQKYDCYHYEYLPFIESDLLEPCKYCLENKRLKEKLMDKNKYLVIGSNNFWYAIRDSLKEANQVARNIIKNKDDVVYACPETGYSPETPEQVYVYKTGLVPVKTFN